MFRRYPQNQQIVVNVLGPPRSAEMALFLISVIRVCSSSAVSCVLSLDWDIPSVRFVLMSSLAKRWINPGMREVLGNREMEYFSSKSELVDNLYQMRCRHGALEDKDDEVSPSFPARVGIVVFFFCQTNPIPSLNVNSGLVREHTDRRCAWLGAEQEIVLQR